MKNDNVKNDNISVDDLEIPKHEGIPYRYMTNEESAKMADIAKKSFYKPKYRQALKVTTQLDVREYCQVHPEAFAKDVLIEMMKRYSSAIPSPILLEMAQVIFSEWESIQTSKKDLVLI